MTGLLLKFIRENPAVAAALIAAFGAILGSFLTAIIWPAARAAATSLAEITFNHFSARFREKRYLAYIVKSHSYLPVLPTTLVPVTDRKSTRLNSSYLGIS